MKYYLLLSLACICTFASAQKSGRNVEYNTSIRIENGNLIEEKSYLIEVTDKQSDWLSDIKIPFSQSSRLEILEACSMNAEQQVVKKLTKKEIVTSNLISGSVFYNNDMVKEFSLRNSEYPYFIKYSYRETINRYTTIARWSPVPENGLPTEKALLIVEVPDDYKLKISDPGGFAFSKEWSKGKLRLTWEARNKISAENEIFSPPEDELSPELIIVPENFIYSIPGKLDSWNSMGQWVDKLIDGLDSLPLSEKIIVTDLLKDITDKKEKMKRLYHYMQDNTHYIAVKIDMGGLQPYSASYVSSNKYGDCKALTIYMKALLKFAGIQSFYTLVNAGYNEKRIDRNLPSFQFNHVILCVPDGNDTIWLENTSGLVPFGYLGPFTQNRYVLVVNGPESRLVRTPAMKTEDFPVRSLYYIKPEISGIASIHLEKEMLGYDSERWLQISTDNQEDKRKEAVSNELSLKNEVIKYELVHPDRDKQNMKLIADLSIYNAFRKIGNSLVLNLPSAGISRLEKPGDRKHPVRINYPVNQTDSIIVEIPYINDYSVELPGNINITSKFGSFSESFTGETGKLKIIRKFIIPVNDIPINEYESFYAFIESINNSIRKSPVVLNKKP